MSDIIQHLPAIALRGTTILPDMIVHFDVSREKSIKAIEKAMVQDQKVFLITQKDPETEEPAQEDLYRIGTIRNQAACKNQKESDSGAGGRREKRRTFKI